MTHDEKRHLYGRKQTLRKFSALTPPAMPAGRKERDARSQVVTGSSPWAFLSASSAGSMFTRSSLQKPSSHRNNLAQQHVRMAGCDAASRSSSKSRSKCLQYVRSLFGCAVQAVPESNLEDHTVRILRLQLAEESTCST